jgi:hypothetical protein
MTKIPGDHWISDIHPISKIFSSVQPREISLPIGVEFHPESLKYFKEIIWMNRCPELFIH